MPKITNYLEAEREARRRWGPHAFVEIAPYGGVYYVGYYDDTDPTETYPPTARWMGGGESWEAAFDDADRMERRLPPYDGEYWATHGPERKPAGPSSPGGNARTRDDDGGPARPAGPQGGQP